VPVLLGLVIGLIGVLIFKHPAVRPEPYVARTVDAPDDVPHGPTFSK